MSLKERLAREIILTGPMTVADYVTRCLHDPEGGYYATRPAIGATGDFITAPMISQMFGELIGLWAIELWRRLGAPERVRLVEVGPGDWTLMADALRAARLDPEFLRAVDLILIEPSPPLRDAQARLSHSRRGECDDNAKAAGPASKRRSSKPATGPYSPT